MEESDEKKQRKNKNAVSNTFTVPLSLGELNENISLNTDNYSNIYKERLINKAYIFHQEGQLSKAVKYYQYIISQEINDHRVFSNYGGILKDLGNLEEAESATRRAIELKPNYAVAYSNLGMILKDLGNLEEAETATRKAIEVKPDFADAHSNLGTILIDLGNLEEAEVATRRAIELKPDFANANFNLGMILKDLGNLEEAEVATRRAIELKPDFVNANFNLGMILKDLGNLEEAELVTRRAIELKPDFTDALLNLGNILKNLGNLKDAEFFTRKVIEINPNYPEAYSNLGNILKDLGKINDAELSYRKAIEINPNFYQANLNLGNILKDLGNLKEAEIITRKAIELKPDFAEAHYNLGNILTDLYQQKKALISLRKAIEINPQFLYAHYNLGNIHYEKGEFEAAIKSFQQALHIDKDFPEARWNLSFAQMFVGDYKSGWENYESRWRIENAKKPHANPPIPKWSGETLLKGERLLVVSEQGLGDTIHFMRYIPYLKSLDINVSFCAQLTLHGIIQSSNIHQNPLTITEANQFSEGKWIPLLSVPQYIGVDSNNPIINDPYISINNQISERWNSLLKNECKPIIGLSWQGNPETETGACKGRSIPLEIFSKISKINNFSFLSLQKGFGSEQLEECSFKDQFVKCQNLINSTSDFLETAAQIKNCDLIITTDSCVAHLAAAMGKPTWVLLKAWLTWRYGLDETTFWYPSMRLFHQKETNNWDEVISRVSLALEIVFDI